MMTINRSSHARSSSSVSDSTCAISLFSLENFVLDEEIGLQVFFQDEVIKIFHARFSKVVILEKIDKDRCRSTAIITFSITGSSTADRDKTKIGFKVNIVSIRLFNI